MPTEVYGNKPETIIYKSAKANRSNRSNHVLLGTYLRVEETTNDWYRVSTRGTGNGGWVQKKDVRETPVLKVFYVDVKQGDGAFIESPQGIMLIDGGPTAKYHSLIKHRYKELIAENGTVHIKAMVISHPDQDHYEGFISLLKNPNFTFGTIYHNGIYRYHGKNLPTGRSFDLGHLDVKRVSGQNETVLTETFDTLDDIRQAAENDVFTTDKGGETAFGRFWKAALAAQAEGRLEGAMQITNRRKTLPGFNRRGEDKLFVEVLGPVPTRRTGNVEYVSFPDPEHLKINREGPTDLPRPSSSHTRNGHSIVLKLHFGKHSFLFGGDLNIPAQLHLLDYYGEQSKDVFKSDVQKACHHGSSDFHVDFLKKVKPQVNVVSSGDNKTFDHPMADALGTIGKHTSGTFPLLFSTELARAESNGKIHYGMINARSNGKDLTFAQMKEKHKNKKDVWDSFTVPWKGRFHEILNASHDTTRMS